MLLRRSSRRPRASRQKGRYSRNASRDNREIRGTRCVLRRAECFFLSVLTAVKLHDQLCAVTHEVHGISPEWRLPAEVDSFVLQAAQKPPKQTLRVGCRPSQLACALKRHRPPTRSGSRLTPLRRIDLPARGGGDEVHASRRRFWGKFSMGCCLNVTSPLRGGRRASCASAQRRAGWGERFKRRAIIRLVVFAFCSAPHPIRLRATRFAGSTSPQGGGGALRIAFCLAFLAKFAVGAVSLP